VFDSVRLRWRSRPSLVDEILTPTPAGPYLPVTPGVLRVAAVQMAHQETDDPAAWIEQCDALTLAAAWAGAQIVVFPALAPWGLVDALSDVELGAAFFAAPGDALSRAHRRRYLRIYPAVHRLHHRTFSFLAHRWKLTIVTGGLPVPQHAVSALVADVFTPDGRTHPGQAYVASGQLLAIPELPAISAGDVALAAVIQDDATSAWLGAALATTSVDVLAVLPDRAPASMDAGGTAAATQTGCYVVRACMVGASGAGGKGVRSGVVSPSDISPDGVILAQAATDDGEEVVVAILDIAARRNRGAAGGDMAPRAAS